MKRLSRTRGDAYLQRLRFIDCEKWRKEFGVDDLVRNFDYKEKPKVFEYYPQYYHKIDKVGFGDQGKIWSYTSLHPTGRTASLY